MSAKRKRPDAGVRSNAQWRAVVVAVKARTVRCAFCRRPLSAASAPAYPHPLSFSVDHVVPISKGGKPYDLANLRGAHFGCNSAAGNRGRVSAGYRPGRPRKRPAAPTTTARFDPADWGQLAVPAKGAPAFPTSAPVDPAIVADSATRGGERLW